MTSTIVSHTGPASNLPAPLSHPDRSHHIIDRIAAAAIKCFCAIVCCFCAIASWSSNIPMKLDNWVRCRRVQRLDPSRNQLTAASDVRRNTQLRTLDLSCNRLTAAPDVSHHIQLQALFLSHNQLITAPDVSQNTLLQHLYLFQNRLTAAPDVSQNTQLRTLILSNNRLTTAPDVSQNTLLQILDLSDNQLTTLPDSILSLSANCTVYAENNRFTPQYIQQFTASLRAHRLAHPGQGPRVCLSIYDEVRPVASRSSLENQICSWSTEFENTYPQQSCQELWGNRSRGGENTQAQFAPLLSLSQENQEILSDYLRRLRSTRDYTTPGLSRNNIILRVDRMLQLANQNTAFRDFMLASIAEGLTSCNDRVQISFDRIEILWQFHFRPLNRDEYRDLAIRAQRYERLIQHAQEQAQSLGLGDEIETILYYLIHLKNDLNLPITTEGMLYAGMSGVTEEMLANARHLIQTISDEELLRESPHWEQHQREEHSAQTESINNQYGIILEHLETYFHLDSDENRTTFLTDHPEIRNYLATNYPASAAKVLLARTAAIARIGSDAENL